MDDLDGLRELLREQREDTDHDGHTYFFHALKGLGGLKVPPDRLAEYDLRIRGYAERLNRFRQRPVQLKYFQYLAILFTELYLDRLFSDRAQFLRELNSLVASENAKLSPGSLNYPPLSEADLTKLAFWMATGSGKTLIMHVNLWQYLAHSAGQAAHDNILLITPNEGLSRQHLRELRESGIAASHYGEAAGTLLGHQGSPVTVIEITKLTETKRGGGLTVEVDAFGPNNLLFVDEGHRGASGEVWRALRAKVAERGFTFEYSATFGQIVNGASRERKPALLEEYSKAILFDYSYPYFYKDGYGKDYSILNLKDDTGAFNDWMLLGNLLSFYEQCLVFDGRHEEIRPYNLEKPLWVFVGHTVTAENEASLTDVEQIVAFISDFLNRRDYWVERIGKVLAADTGLKNQRDDDLFKDSFEYLKSLKLPAAALYERILSRVFNAAGQGSLRSVELKAASGEIGLRAGADKPYFGVINVGDVSGLRKRIEARDIVCEDENITGSLFDDVNRVDSPVNILIGSRKFMEGWDSFRVSSMGLMNIGRGEGAQIIQLFGRGVRLWGRDYCLKRTAALSLNGVPGNIRLLETLNVFGVRANYMAQLREYLQQEGINTDVEEVAVPIRLEDAFLRRGLETLRPPEDGNFAEDEGLVLAVDADLQVTLDVRPAVEIARSEEGQDEAGKLATQDRAEDLRRLKQLLDWERIYFDVLSFARAKGMSNVSITMQALEAVFQSANYRVLVPDGVLPPPSIGGIRRAEALAASVLKKYTAKLYDKARRGWERDRLRLVPLDGDDQNLVFGAYRVHANPDFVAKVRELVAKADELYKADVENFPSIHFDRHLYQPLLLADSAIESMSPPGLNEGEKTFIRGLRTWLQEHHDELKDREVYLLRNLTRGRGIGFFESKDGESFYPDFILWVMRPGRQCIAFIDPHGMRNVRGLSDPKIQLHERLRDLSANLKSSDGKSTVGLTSFILATASYDELKANSWLRDHTKEELDQRHILFQKDSDYIIKLLKGLG